VAPAAPGAADARAGTGSQPLAGSRPRTVEPPRTAGQPRTTDQPRTAGPSRTTDQPRTAGPSRTADRPRTADQPRTPARRTGTTTAATRAVPAAAGRAADGADLAPRTGAFPVRPPVVSQGSAARFAERVRARRRLAWRQIAGVAGGAVALGGLAWLLLLSPVLALDPEQVRVTGAGTVVAVDQVAAVVDQEVGVPLTRVDTTQLRTALLEVPGVRDVTLTRDWPRGLTVALVAREPVAAVPEQPGEAPPSAADAAPGPAEGEPGAAEAAGPGYALVDEDGVQVGRSDAAPEGLPVVEVPVGEGRTLSAALGVLESLPDALLADIGQVSAGTQDTVRFVLRDGATVEWGSAQQPGLKAAVLQALRVAPETAGAGRYDVSAPTMPVVG
jgi:cell division protein FtsQ